MWRGELNQAMVRDSTAKSENNTNLLFDRRTVYECLLVFVAAWAILFLLSSRIVNGFDEGILLTATMRTMAGQVLHRDFYYDYGPAQVYLLGGLFKLFGSSVLVERLADVFFNSCLVVTMYALARKFCSRAIAVAAAVICVLWLIGLMLLESMMNPTLCTLALWTSWLILPQTDDRLQRRRALCAGLLTAIMFLFRYDMAVGFVAANLAAMVIMTWLQERGARRTLRRLVATAIGPYLAAFAVVVIPAALVYLSVAPLHDFLYDVVIYMAKYYRVGRGLPFPIPRLGPTFQEIAVYLLPVIISLGFWVAARWVIMRRTIAADESTAHTPAWVNLLVALGVIAAMICARGMVRAGVGGMYGGVMACVLIAAVLVQHRAMLNLWSRSLMVATLALFVLAAGSSAEIQLFYPMPLQHGFHLRPLVVNRILSPNRQLPLPEFRSWCYEDTPITKGFCFLQDEDHIQTIRYLDAHTRPGDYLYEGLPHHDRIIQNDNILYFAVQRLPAVRWSQFDPFLQNREDIQQEMIGGLEQHKPPYIVLDSAFDNLWEPNGSSVHTGVHLLDDYIAAHYKEVQKYGELTILQRQ
jgi:hypothetical protein